MHMESKAAPTNSSMSKFKITWQANGNGKFGSTDGEFIVEAKDHEEAAKLLREHYGVKRKPVGCWSREI
jgi:hypothetical protein